MLPPLSRLLSSLVISSLCLPLSSQTKITNEQVFEGKWTSSLSNSSLSSKSSILRHFVNDKGVILILMYSHSRNNEELTIVISILDGQYKENWLSITKQFKRNPLPTNLTSQSKIVSPQNLEPLGNDEVILQSHSLFKSGFRTQRELDKLELNIQGDLGKKTQGVHNAFNGVIELNEMNLSISFEAKEIKSRRVHGRHFHRKSFFFFFLTSIGFGHLITLYNTIRRQYRLSGFKFDNYSPYLLALDMIWNFLIFISSANLSFASLENSISYATIAFIYFFIFSFLEGILFFYSFNLKKRRALIKMICIMALSITATLLLHVFMLQYPILITLLIATTFIPQIALNVQQKGKHNKLSSKFIAMLAINRLFIPVYLRLIPRNLFKAEPHYFYVTALVGCHLVQIAVLYMQGEYGGDCIVPKRFKEGYYNYKVDIEKVVKENREFYSATCSICLELFVKNDIESGLRAVSICEQVRNWLTKRKKSYIMMTPCKHYFHSHCLLFWIEKKKCPICRMDLPAMI